MENNLWYVRHQDGRKEGGFTDEQLKALIDKGIVEGQDEIWTMKMQNWMKLEASIYSFYIPEETK